MPHPPDPTCDYGSAELCGAQATWAIWPEKFPTFLYACDRHITSMAGRASQAKRFSWAPPMSEALERAYVTALAWESYFARGTEFEVERRLGFQQARDAFVNRYGAAACRK